MLGGTSQASITGVGNTRYSKKADRSAERLAMEAVLAAAADAGIEPTQIDGLIPYPGHIGDDVIQAELGINPRFRVTVDMGGCSAVSALRVASMAVMSGAAKHVLLFRGLKGNSGARKADRPSFLPGQSFRRQLEHVYGMNTPAQRYAVLCQRYKHEYGLDRRTLGEIALAARAHANLNPDAQMYGRELTMEDYLAGRLIAAFASGGNCRSTLTAACCRKRIKRVSITSSRPLANSGANAARGRWRMPGSSP